jgi:hypothetical protein
MAIETDADLAELFDTDFSATAGTFTPDGGSASTVNGIFGNVFFEIPAGETSIEGKQASFICKTSDVSSAAHGDTLVVSGTTYTVRGVQPDGTGVTTLILES